MSIHPRCTKCDSQKWIDTKDQSDEKKIEKLHQETISHLSNYARAAKIIDLLIINNDRLVVKYEKLESICKELTIMCDTSDKRFLNLRNRVQKLET